MSHKIFVLNENRWPSSPSSPLSWQRANIAVSHPPALCLHQCSEGVHNPINGASFMLLEVLLCSWPELLWASHLHLTLPYLNPYPRDSTWAWAGRISPKVLEPTRLYVTVQLIDSRRQTHSVQLMDLPILQSYGNTCLLKKSLSYLCKPCEVMILLSKWDSFPKRFNSVTSAKATEWPIHSPKLWGLRAIIVILCSKNQIYIESILPANRSHRNV